MNDDQNSPQTQLNQSDESQLGSADPAGGQPAPADPTVTQAPVAPDPTSTVQLMGMNVTEFRSLLVKIMLGALVAAALVAVIAILVGSMNDIAWKAINTIISGVIHILILFGVISVTESGNAAMQRSTNFVINSSLIIVICSFFTTIFGTWDLISPSLVSKLYATYFVLLFVIVHAKTLMDVEAIYDKVKPYVLANYVFMAIVSLLILGIVYLPNGGSLLNGFYGRLLAAAAIVDITISIIVAVMHILYIQKHPELQQEAKAKKAGSAGMRIIVAIILFLFVSLPIIWFAAIGLLGLGYPY